MLLIRDKKGPTGGLGLGLGFGVGTSLEADSSLGFSCACVIQSPESSTSTKLSSARNSRAIPGIFRGTIKSVYASYSTLKFVRLFVPMRIANCLFHSVDGS